jgi:hypothetical protein
MATSVLGGASIAQLARSMNATRWNKEKAGTVKLSDAQIRVLNRAARRAEGNVCPTPGVSAAAQDRLLEALDRRGLITWDGGVAFKGAPRINEAGRRAVQFATSETPN